VKFSDAKRELQAQGWRCDAETLISPSGGFWFYREMLEGDELGLYAQAARRVHKHRCYELAPLLNVLCNDPAVAALAEHLALLESELAWLSSQHAMRLSLWDFEYPSVRATARHPSGGVAVVECVTDDPPDFQVLAYHWIDDHARSIRLSRRASFPQSQFSVASLRRAAEDAVAFLLLSPEASPFDKSSQIARLAAHWIASDEDYWSKFEVLR
jgi:hypothetical protein